MKNKEPERRAKRPPSRLKWVSITLNVVFAFAAWGIATDHLIVSASPMQIASAPQAQVLPASLPNPYLAGRE